MKSEIPAPLAAIAVVIVLVVIGVFLYRGATGGVQGDGKTGNVEASPPVGPAAKQGLQSIYQRK